MILLARLVKKLQNIDLENMFTNFLLYLYVLFLVSKSNLQEIKMKHDMYVALVNAPCVDLVHCNEDHFHINRNSILGIV
jgi:hypothetical protein